MVENLFSPAHKHNSKKYINNWPNIFRKEEYGMRVFVYGTLMSGEPRNVWMAAGLRGKKVCAAELNDFRLYANMDHPTVREEKGCSVKGELWKFDQEEEEVLGQLDMVEGYPDYYIRKKVTVDNGKAWVYIMSDLAFAQQQKMGIIKPIEGGDWRDVSKRERAGFELPARKKKKKGK